MTAEARTTTEEALLGLLSIRPMSGYELKQMIEASIGHFWRESFGQIYPTLKRLESGGWICAEKQPGLRPAAVRASRRYGITPLGCERLHAWLPLPAKPQVPRNELLLKLFFGANAPAAMKEQLAAARRTYAEHHARYEAIAAELQKTRSHLPGFPYWMMTIRYGLVESRTMLAWAEESLRVLEGLEDGTAKNSKSNRRMQHAH